MRVTNLRLQQWTIAVFAMLAAQSSILEIAAAADTSGQYFQVGARGVTLPGQLQPQALVAIQIDLGTLENCESRLALMAKNKELVEVFGSGALWCSSESATAQLKFHGAFRNRITGKTLVVESQYIEVCTWTVEALTGGQAPSNKIEVTTACQAR